MPQFRFSVDVDGAVETVETVELETIDAVRTQAAEFASRILHDLDGAIFDADWRVRVTDNAGLELFQIIMVGLEAPAISGKAVSHAAR